MSDYRLPRHMKTRLDAVRRWLQVTVRHRIHANQSENNIQIMTTDFIHIFVQSAAYRQIRIYFYEAGLNGYSHRIVTLLPRPSSPALRPLDGTLDVYQCWHGKTMPSGRWAVLYYWARHGQNIVLRPYAVGRPTFVMSIGKVKLA
jgi:hypothetical protein